MAFKMKGAPYPKAAFKDAGHGGDMFHIHETPKMKAQRDLDAMAAGSRFNPDGTRKRGDARREAREMRKWTGLDQQKYDRELRREDRKFTRKYGEGQEGLDKFRDKQQKKRKRKKNMGKVTKAIGKVVEAVNPFDAKSKAARAARKIARGNKDKGKGGKHGQGCKDGVCDQGGIKGK
jgi:hypothetical protein